MAKSSGDGFGLGLGFALAGTALSGCGPTSEVDDSPPPKRVSAEVSESITAASLMPLLTAPAGNRPATRHVQIDGFDAAVLPSGRIVTPTGTEIGVTAPKPDGLALSTSGTISGRPTAVGSFAFTVQAQDATSGSPLDGSQRLTIDVAAPAITIGPTVLNDAKVALVMDRDQIVGVVSKIDLIDFLASRMTSVPPAAS